MHKTIGDEFWKETKYTHESLGGYKLDRTKIPPTYKEYPDVERIKLSHEGFKAERSFHDTVSSRKSIRNFRDKNVSQQELSYILWSSTGIQRHERGRDFRTSPSAGARYPIETYLVVTGVDGIKKGVYHYNVREHSLELLREGDLSVQTAAAALGQEMVVEAPVTFIWTAVFYRTLWKYRQRGYRYILLDAGHVAGQFALAATAMELGSCQIAALFDEEVNSIIEVDGEKESVLYMSTLGVPRF